MNNPPIVHTFLQWAVSLLAASHHWNASCSWHMTWRNILLLQRSLYQTLWTSESGYRRRRRRRRRHPRRQRWTLQYNHWGDISPIYRVAGTVYAIGRVRPSFRLFVVFFRFIFWTDWPPTLIFCTCNDNGHSSYRIEIQGHRSQSKVKVSVWIYAAACCKY